MNYHPLPLKPVNWPVNTVLRALAQEEEGMALPALRKRWEDFIAPFASFPLSSFPSFSLLSLPGLLSSQGFGTLVCLEGDEVVYCSVARELQVAFIAVSPQDAERNLVGLLKTYPPPYAMVVSSPCWKDGHQKPMFRSVLSAASSCALPISVWWDASLAGLVASPLSVPSLHPAFSGAWADLSLLTGACEAPSIAIARNPLPISVLSDSFAGTWLEAMSATSLWRKYAQENAHALACASLQPSEVLIAGLASPGRELRSLSFAFSSSAPKGADLHSFASLDGLS